MTNVSVGNNTVGIPAKFSWVARLGYAARGVVYVLVGGLALWSALLIPGRQTKGSHDALYTLIGEPFGQTCLSLIGLGLVGYTLWRLVQGLADADHHGRNLKGLTIRIALVVSGVIHFSLALYTFQLVLGSAQRSSGNSQAWAAQVMQYSWGRWLIVLIGGVIIAAGIAQGAKGWRKKFMKYLKISQNRLGTVCHICRFGLVAKGVVFFIIGLLFISSAINYDPSEARGLAAVFSALRAQPFGKGLLVIISLGMLSFGLYSFIEASYRRIDPS